MKRLRVILRLTACPRCRYSLAGLPAVHACPECGFEFDATMTCLDVWDSDEEPKILTLLGNGVMASFFALYSLAVFWGSPPVSVWRAWPVMGAIAFTLGFLHQCRRFVIRFRGQTETALTFSSKGWALSEHQQIQSWQGWDTLPATFLRRMRGGRWRIMLRSNWWLGLLDWRKSVVFRADRRMAAAVRGRIRMFKKVAREKHQVELKRADPA